MKLLGVDIGSYSVKIAELDVTNKGYSFSNFLEFPLSLDPQKDRSLEIIEILRRVSSQQDSSTRWIIAVPQQQVSVHQKRFPFRERSKILRSLAFELEDEIPLDIDETIFDAKILQTLGPTADVLTIAAPKESVETALQVASDGGFDPEIVSVEGLALANVFDPSFDAPPPEGTAPITPNGEEAGLEAAPRAARIVLHMGHNRTNLLVFRGDVLVAVRNLLWGGADVADALSRAFSIPIFEAVKVLQTKSFILMNSAGATKDQILLSKTVSGVVDILMRDLRLTLLEVRAGFNLEFEKLEITGGTSQIQNLSAYITQSLEIQTNVIHPLQGLPLARFEMNDRIEAVSTVALGLALEGVRRPRNPAVNLRKEEFARENETLKRFWETWHVPVYVAIAAYFIFFGYSITRDILGTSLVEAAETRLMDVAKNVANLGRGGQNERGVRGYISSQKKLIRDREALEKAETMNSAFDILAQVAAKLPVQAKNQASKGFDITHFVVDNADLTIQGRAYGGQAIINQIESRLKDLGAPKADKQLAAQVPPGAGTPFAFRMKVDRQQ